MLPHDKLVLEEVEKAGRGAKTDTVPSPCEQTGSLRSRRTEECPHPGLWLEHVSARGGDRLALLLLLLRLPEMPFAALMGVKSDILCPSPASDQILEAKDRAGGSNDGEPPMPSSDSYVIPKPVVFD